MMLKAMFFAGVLSGVASAADVGRLADLLEQCHVETDEVTGTVKIQPVGSARSVVNRTDTFPRCVIKNPKEPRLTLHAQKKCGSSGIRRLHTVTISADGRRFDFGTFQDFESDATIVNGRVLGFSWGRVPIKPETAVAISKMAKPVIRYADGRYKEDFDLQPDELARFALMAEVFTLLKEIPLAAVSEEFSRRIAATEKAKADAAAKIAAEKAEKERLATLEKDNKAAASKMRFAKSYIAKGKAKLARKYLTEIMSKFKHTDAAKEAGTLFQSLK